MVKDDRLVAQSVEICVDEWGKVWITVDGEMILRIKRSKRIDLDCYGRDPKRLWPTKDSNVGGN